MVQDGDKRPNIAVTGTGKVQGGSFGRIRILGEGEVEGDSQCGELKVTGNLVVRGALRAERAIVIGVAAVEGDLRGDEVRVKGELRVSGNCESELLHVRGAVNVSGLLSAEDVDIKLHGSCRVHEIGGNTVRVRPNLPFISSSHRMTADVIEGDDIHLVHTSAAVVRGSRVTIGRGCDIGTVEYKEDYRCVKQAKIGHVVPTGDQSHK